jgi:hypothetical protein
MQVTQLTFSFPKINIPESWDTVEEFCDWYITNGMPMKFPENVEIFSTDDATSVCLFRKGQFQVELYLILPKPNLPKHEHPNVEAIEVRLDNTDRIEGEVLRKGQSHGPGIRVMAEERGFPLISVQKWLNGIKPTTISTCWKGKTVGPKHDELIKRFCPETLVLDGYADVTKPNNYLKVLKNGTNS